MVRALSVIPFCEPLQGTIKVACTAPVPRIALSALRRITGLVPEPYLVTDRLWRELLESYGADTISHATETTDVAEAAAMIARAAVEGRGARLAEIHWEAYTRVVLADTGTHDVVLVPFQLDARMDARTSLDRIGRDEDLASSRKVGPALETSRGR